MNPRDTLPLPGLFSKLDMGPVKSEFTSFYHGMGPCGSRRWDGDEITISSKRTGGQHRAAVTFRDAWIEVLTSWRRRSLTHSRSLSASSPPRHRGVTRSGLFPPYDAHCPSSPSIRLCEPCFSHHSAKLSQTASQCRIPSCLFSNVRPTPFTLFL